MESNHKQTDSILFYELFDPINRILSTSLDESFSTNLSYQKDQESQRNLIVYKDERIYDYFIFQSGQFHSTQGKAKMVLEYAVNKYRLEQRDGSVLFFSDPFSCKVTGIYTPDGRQFFFEYNTKKQLISIKNFYNFYISLTWNNGKLFEVTETIYPFHG